MIKALLIAYYNLYIVIHRFKYNKLFEYKISDFNDLLERVLSAQLIYFFGLVMTNLP